MTRVISFSSGKGGVGKTSLVANMGHLWAGKGKNTLLVDADWTLGKLGITLGVRPQWTVDQVLSGEIALKSAIQAVSPNLSLLASPTGVVGFEELDEESRNQLFYELEQLASAYDLILLDHSSGVHWGVLQFAAAAHQHVIVTTAEPTSYTDAYAIMKILSKRFAIREFWLLVTQSSNHAQTEGIISRFSDVARSHLDVRVNLLDIFPWEPRVSESIRLQQPFVQRFPYDRLTCQMGEVCGILDRHPGRPTHGLKFFYEEQVQTLLNPLLG